MSDPIMAAITDSETSYVYHMSTESFEHIYSGAGTVELRVLIISRHPDGRAPAAAEGMLHGQVETVSYTTDKSRATVTLKGGIVVHYNPEVYS